MLRKIIGILIVVAIVGGGVAYYLWNKPHKTAEGEKPVATLTADALIEEYSGDIPGSNSKYLEKVLEINGTVSTIGTSEMSETKISLQTNATDELGLPSNITFIMKQGEKTDDIKEGTTIALKGICTGYNTDVEFKQAVVVHK